MTTRSASAAAAAAAEEERPFMNSLNNETLEVLARYAETVIATGLDPIKFAEERSKAEQKAMPELCVFYDFDVLKIHE